MPHKEPNAYEIPGTGKTELPEVSRKETPPEVVDGALKRIDQDGNWIDEGNKNDKPQTIT